MLFNELACACASMSLERVSEREACSVRPMPLEKLSRWDPAVSAISGRDGMKIAARVDANAK